MLIEITRENHDTIKNPVFAAHAGMYLQIYDDFMSQIASFGLEVDENDYAEEIAERRAALSQKGAIFRNDDRSIYVNAISPACVACQTGVGSETFFVSLKCHRDCYYCFNPNQVDYDHYSQNKRDVIGELNELKAAGAKLTHLAITGGEPLLFPDDVIAVYAHTNEQFPGVYKRLYTCGDYVNEENLQRLKEVGTEEIRFSIRMHDLERGHRYTLERIAAARDYIPNVMVEMPVLPGTLEIMQELLMELDDLDIASINLLEFCYPFGNPETFQQKGFKIKKRPYKIPYNYWYAGGLPISQSELVCLDLVDFALERALSIGVHYCSLENKFTAQIYEQNYGKPVPDYMHFSTKDYFYRSAKVFGDDIPQVIQRFEQKRFRQYRYDRQRQFLEFNVNKIRTLRDLDIEVGVATSVVETRDGESFLRELKIDLAYPGDFTVMRDL